MRGLARIGGPMLMPTNPQLCCCQEKEKLLMANRFYSNLTIPNPNGLIFDGLF
jgi:hypothetical protein